MQRQKIRTLSESVEELVLANSDLTVYAGIGEAISHAIREIVHTGTIEKMERLRSLVPPEIAGLKKYPRLDPKRVLRAYKKLGISSVDELIAKLDSGELARVLGARLAHNIRQGVTETHAILLYKAHELRAAVEASLLDVGKVRAVEAAGSYRRRGRTHFFQERSNDLSIDLELVTSTFALAFVPLMCHLLLSERKALTPNHRQTRIEGEYKPERGAAHLRFSSESDSRPSLRS